MAKEPSKPQASLARRARHQPTASKDLVAAPSRVWRALATVLHQAAKVARGYSASAVPRPGQELGVSVTAVPIPTRVGRSASMGRPDPTDTVGNSPGKRPFFLNYFLSPPRQ